jgi:hypothetical protein
MVAWIVCPTCRLKHTERQTGVCPRCNNAVTAPAPSPSAPAAAAAATSLPSLARGPAGLGRLAQSARSTRLTGARNLMLFVGGLTVLVNLFFLVQVEREGRRIAADLRYKIDSVIYAPQGLGDLWHEYYQNDDAMRLSRLVNGGAIVVGLAFLVCAAKIRRAPVPATITALCLYLGATAIPAAFSTEILLQGLIPKVIVMLALMRAVGTALAYQKENSAAVGT